MNVLENKFVEIPSVKLVLQRGKCINCSQCHCDEGYSGEEWQNSETVTCFGKDLKDATDCSTHATCTANDTCTCTQPSNLFVDVMNWKTFNR